MTAEPRTIKLTPTWPEACRLLLAVLENGTPEGQDMARRELARMAEIAQSATGETVLALIDPPNGGPSIGVQMDRTETAEALRDRMAPDGYAVQIMDPDPIHTSADAAQAWALATLAETAPA